MYKAKQIDNEIKFIENSELINLKGFEKLIKKINKIENTTIENSIMSYFISEINDAEVNRKSLLNNKIKLLLENIYESVMNEINPLNHFICGSNNTDEVESEGYDGDEESEAGDYTRSEMNSSGIDIEFVDEKDNNNNEKLGDEMNENV